MISFDVVKIFIGARARARNFIGARARARNFPSQQLAYQSNFSKVVFQVTGFQSFQSFPELGFRKIFVFIFKFSVRFVHNRVKLSIKVNINSIRQLLSH